MRKKGNKDVLKLKDGIVVDRKIRITDASREKFRFLSEILQVLVIIFGSYSTLGILIHCFSLPVKQNVILFVTILGGIIIYFLYAYPAYDLLKTIIGFMVYLLMIRWNFKHLENAFYILENAVLARASEYYGISSLRFVADYSTAEVDVTIFLLMVLILILCLIALSVVRCKNIVVSVIIMFVPAIASFCFGITPKEKFMVPFLFSMIYLLRSYYNMKGKYGERKRHRNKIIYDRVALLITVLVIILFFGMKIIVPKSKYDNMTHLKVMKLELQHRIEKFSFDDLLSGDLVTWPFSKDTAHGGVNGGKLGHIEEIVFTGKEQLYVTIPRRALQEGIYLRGYVGTVYNKDQWNGHTEKNRNNYQKVQNNIQDELYHPMTGVSSFLSKISSLDTVNSSNILDMFSSPILSIRKGTIKIEYKEANNDFLYTPYSVLYQETDNILPQDDLYVKPGGKHSPYRLQFYYDINLNDVLHNFIIPDLPQLEEYSADEKEYRDYVYATYRSVPDKGIERLKQDFSKQRIGKETNTLEKAIEYTRNYLNENTEYSLAPGKLPYEKDFVEYFLYENRLGYCVHYASTATLMLRLMGYPARYVEGYVISPSDETIPEDRWTQKTEIITNGMVYTDDEEEVTVKVRDYSAHAWVEVYVDGIGWFPIEVTPSAGLTGTLDVLQDYQQYTDSIVKEEEEYEELNPTPTPTVTPKEDANEEENAPSPTPTPKVNNQKNETSGTKQKKEEHISWPWFILVVSTFFLIGIYFITLYKKRRVKVTTRSTRAIATYKDMEKMFKKTGYIRVKSLHLEDAVEHMMSSCPYIVEEDFLMWMELIQKARFSKDILNRSELQYVNHYYREIKSNILADYPKLRRLWYSIILRT